jgi:hypothetical protein
MLRADTCQIETTVGKTEKKPPKGPEDWQEYKLTEQPQ